jgi:hypothetical protein
MLLAAAAGQTKLKQPAYCAGPALAVYLSSRAVNDIKQKERYDHMLQITDNAAAVIKEVLANNQKELPNAMVRVLIAGYG